MPKTLNILIGLERHETLPYYAYQLKLWTQGTVKPSWSMSIKPLIKKGMKPMMKRTKPPQGAKATNGLEKKFMQLEQAHRLREDFMRANTKLVNQIEASKRRIEKNPVHSSLSPECHYEAVLGAKVFKGPKMAYGKQMETLVKGFPAFDWFCSIPGCAAGSFAAILAETGDLSNYANPAKVWKRLGLAVNGEGESDKNRTKGINTGYSKRRRMVIYRVGVAIVKTGKEYRQIYLDRKAYEVERDQFGYNEAYVKRNRTAMLSAYASKPNQERIKNGQLPMCVIDLRAQRYMTKRLIRDLWIKWNQELGTYKEEVV